MNKTNRVLSVILAALLLTGTIACGQETGNGESDTAAGSISQATAAGESESPYGEKTDNGRSATKDSLPDSLNFDGASISVLSRGGDADTLMEFYAEEMTGDVINDSVFTRNLAVQERLNMGMDIILSSDVTRHGGMPDKIRESVSAGLDEYQLISNAMYNTMLLVPEKLFLDLGSLEYLDFSAPWYNQAFLETTNLNGKNYVVMGELSQTMISGAFCMFFNKNLLTEYYSDEVNLYQIVNNGEWTLDKMISLCEPVYTDTNGNGVADEGDIFGHFFTNTQTLGADSFYGASKVELLSRAEDGSFVYNGTSERMVEFTEKMHKLLFEGNNTVRLPDNNEQIMDTMLSRQTIFTTWMLTGINFLREMDDNFGIIPMPKLNEDQESYTSYTHDGSSAFTIPVTNQNPAVTAAFLEAMSAETYRTVTPAYFETAIKSKYSRDSETSQMLDMIIQGIYLDYSYIFGQSLGAPISTVRSLLADSSACENAVSTMKSLEKITLVYMKKLMQKYDEME